MTIELKTEFSLKLPEERIETPVATIWLDENGWLVSVSKNVPHTVENLKAHFSITEELLDGRKTHFLTFPNLAQSINAEARRYLDEVMPKQMIAIAYITTNAMMRIGLNIFFRLSNNVVPMRTFSDTNQAFEWLDKQK